MASVFQEPNGRQRVDFVGLDRKRRSIRLGLVPEKSARLFAARVESILEAAALGQSLDAQTAKWMADLPEASYVKLVAAGLAHPREKKGQEQVLLGPFLAALLTRRSDVKPGTAVCFEQVVQNLREFFGADKRLQDVTAGDADDFRRWLLQVKKYSSATAGRRCGRAKEFFRDACRRRLLDENPFEEIDQRCGGNPARQAFVSREVIARVIDAAPSPEWRLVIGLARYAGLRTPSEPFSLRWSDVDVEHGRLHVRSPKTEHIEGRDVRVVPLMPELRPLLADVFDVAPEGSEFVLQRLMDRYPRPKRGWGAINLRSHFQKIIRKAGEKPWVRLWHNLRSSCQTELTERFPVHVVCQWLGNSERIAQKHYLQVTDQHFQLAVDGEENPQHKTQQSLPNAAESAANLALGNAKTPVFRGFAVQKMTEAGFEPALPFQGTGF